ncbi:hypothetical protein ABZ865_13420 [Streptomyces sp. NPDC047085]|uniref:hypothetical protein n=1 Tax=Streptomyces sp. NPDC047085 TaxID=3155140 RepID=UPI0033F96E9C
MAVDSAGEPHSTVADLAAVAGAIAASGLGSFAGVGAATALNLRVENETLTTFKNRVDDLLTRLEHSKAAPHRIAHGALPTGRLGTFDEADALHAAYTRVHTQLETLSKMLALQIEGLVVTVEASKRNYRGVDDDVRARLSRIRVEADRLTAHSGGLSSARGASHGPQGSVPEDTEAGGL